MYSKVYRTKPGGFATVRLTDHEYDELLKRFDLRKFRNTFRLGRLENHTPCILCENYSDNTRKHICAKCTFYIYEGKKSIGCMEWMVRTFGKKPYALEIHPYRISIVTYYNTRMVDISKTYVDRIHNEIKGFTYTEE
jgi:hypothetical protein